VRLYARQAGVVVNYSREAAAAEAVAAECRALGADALVVCADIAVAADCRRLAAEVGQRFAVPTSSSTRRHDQFVAAKDLDGLDADDFIASTAPTSSAPS
jgi:NAD(P)-dependent dehydrogenase (short-subunit alcohol dehydrogenase family)